jgi:hypothetical protein
MANLVTIEEYKEAEGIISPKDDLRLNNLVPSVSQLVKTYCGNSIVDYYTSNKTETININWDTNIVQLTESPVLTISSVEERPSYDAAYETLTTNNYDYYLDEATDSLIRTNGSGYRNWRKGPGAVRVTYQAGYEECPADLKLAVIDLITYYLKDEHKERKTLAGATVTNQTSSSQTNNVAFPDHIKRVLDLYKNF